jgi:hypothetical protein
VTRVETSMLGLEVRSSTERMLNLTSGAWALGVRVRWRAHGRRRWSTFLLWPDEGQAIEELLEHAADAADRVYSDLVTDLRVDEFVT